MTAPAVSEMLPKAQPGEEDGENVRDAVMDDDDEEDIVTEGVAVSVELQLREAPNEPVDVPVTVTDDELTPDADAENEGVTELRGEGQSVNGVRALKAEAAPPPLISTTPLPELSCR